MATTSIPNRVRLRELISANSTQTLQALANQLGISRQRVEQICNADKLDRKRPKKTHCRKGHEWSAENTYWTPKTVRSCRTCARTRQQRFDERHGIIRSILRGKGSRNRTHCIHGHEFTPSNTYRNPKNGTRSCQVCRRDALERQIKRQRERAAAVVGSVS